MNEKCFKITSKDAKLDPTLQCHQEEADGRLLLHAKRAAREGYKSVVIGSEDTDVFVMALAFQDVIGIPLFQKCRNRTRTRLIYITKIATSVGIVTCRALVGMHAYTGCDTVSAFAGKGKASSLWLLNSSAEMQETFAQLGQTWDVSTDLMDQLEAFTCLLYAHKSASSTVNR